MKLAEARTSADRVAWWVSEVLWPPWVVIALVGVSGLAADLPLSRQLGWGLLACVFVGLLPLTVGLLAIRSGRLPGRHLPDRRDRLRPFTWTSLSALLGTVLLVSLGAPREVVAVQAAMLSGSVTILLLSRWAKISMHTGVVASAAVLLGILFGPIWWLSGSLVVLVGWSRLHLGHHTPAEVMIGAVAGALSAWPAVLLLG